MKKMMLAAGCLAVSAVPVTASMMMTSAPPSHGNSPLHGAWQVLITPDDSDSFININTFDADGAVVNVSPVFGAGVGDSYRTGPNQFHIVFHGFNDDTSRFKAIGSITLDDQNTFSGEYVTEIYDLDGNFLFDFEGTLLGNRL